MAIAKAKNIAHHRHDRSRATVSRPAVVPVKWHICPVCEDIQVSAFLMNYSKLTLIANTKKHLAYYCAKIPWIWIKHWKPVIYTKRWDQEMSVRTTHEKLVGVWHTAHLCAASASPEKMLFLAKSAFAALSHWHRSLFKKQIHHFNSI